MAIRNNQPDIPFISDVFISTWCSIFVQEQQIWLVFLWLLLTNEAKNRCLTVIGCTAVQLIVFYITQLHPYNCHKNLFNHGISCQLLVSENFFTPSSYYSTITAVLKHNQWNEWNQNCLLHVTCGLALVWRMVVSDETLPRTTMLPNGAKEGRGKWYSLEQDQ